MEGQHTDRQTSGRRIAFTDLLSEPKNLKELESIIQDRNCHVQLETMNGGMKGSLKVEMNK